MYFHLFLQVEEARDVTLVLLINTRRKWTVIIHHVLKSVLKSHSQSLLDFSPSLNKLYVYL